jgi:hypothetical protein
MQSRASQKPLSFSVENKKKELTQIVVVVVWSCTVSDLYSTWSREVMYQIDVYPNPALEILLLQRE